MNGGDGVPGAEPPGDVDQPEVGDDGVAVLQEDVLRLEVLRDKIRGCEESLSTLRRTFYLVDDAAVVEVAHALRDLLRDDHQLVHRELVLAQVQVRVQRVPLEWNNILISFCF